MRRAVLFLFMIATELHAAESSAWKTLSPLPDPVGFGGMVAGVGGDVLFVAGGSRFIDKPVWDGGKKEFSDRIFTLKSPNEAWTELGQRLPIPLAHSACAIDGAVSYSVGGVNETGALANVYRLELADGKLKVETLPPLPHPLVYGAAAVAGDVLYVFGGVSDPASTQPSKEFWALPLKDAAAWQRLPDFPGKPVIVGTAGSDGGAFYAFGGMHYLLADEGKTRPVPQDNVYRFDPQTQQWTQLADMPFPRVGAASPAPFIGGKFLLAGGYGFVFPGLAKDHPGFERETAILTTASDSWTQGPPLPCARKIDATKPTAPGPEPMVAAPAIVWQNLVVLVSGEVRPATRTTAVVALPLSAIR